MRTFDNAEILQLGNGRQERLMDRPHWTYQGLSNGNQQRVMCSAAQNRGEIMAAYGRKLHSAVITTP
jgi:hypothetical protein